MSTPITDFESFMDKVSRAKTLVEARQTTSNAASELRSRIDSHNKKHGYEDPDMTRLLIRIRSFGFFLNSGRTSSEFDPSDLPLYRGVTKTLILSHVLLPSAIDQLPEAEKEK